MERSEALPKLKLLEGRDIRPMANTLQVTVLKNGKINKGWFGHTIERYLGLPINSSQSPNFGSWELKTFPLKYKKNGDLVVKETMAITMIDPYNIARTEFEDSHLLNKLKKIIWVARIFKDKQESSSIFYKVAAYDLIDANLLSEIKADYDLVRVTLLDESKGWNALTGKMGKWIQPRTKGPGHGSTSRAFYAKKSFLNRLIGMPYEA